MFKKINISILISVLFCLQNIQLHGQSPLINRNQIIEIIDSGKHYQANIPSLAKVFFAEASLFSKASHQYDLQSEAIKGEGVCEFFMGNFDSSLAHYQKALNIRNQINRIIPDSTNQYAIASLYSNIALIYDLTGQSERSLTNYYKAEGFRQQIGDLYGLAHFVYGNIAKLFMAQSDYPNSLEYLFKSLLIYELLNEKHKKSDILDMIGAVYLETEDFESALKYFNQSLYIRKNLSDTLSLSMSYNNLGNVYQRLKDYDKAAYYYLKSLPLKELVSDKIGISKLLNNIGLIYFYQNSHFESIKYFNQSIEIAENYNDFYQLTTVLINLGNAYIETAQFGKAMEVLTRSKVLSEKYQFLSLQLYSYEYLAKLYYKQNIHKETNFYLLKVVTLKDSLKNDQSLKQVAQSELKYEYDKKIFTDSLQRSFTDEQKALQHQAELNEQQLILYFALGLIILLLIIGYLMIQSLKFKTINKELRFKQKAAELEKQMLLSQMNPHFIFNALNSIQNYIVKNEPELAAKYLSKFASLIRLILENSDSTMIPFEDELKTVQYYLDLEKTRFENKFDFQITIDDSIESEEIYVPPMLIQPYIENAIIHGIGNKEGKGFITISFSNIENQPIIQCVIIDNGIGRQKSKNHQLDKVTKKKSLGLHISTDRLKILNEEYHKNIHAEITDLFDQSGHPSGTKVEIILPYIYKQ